MKRIVIAGGSGFLGQVLAAHFRRAGWEAVVLTRARDGHSSAGARFARWDGETIGGWSEELEGAAAVVNLSGRSVDCRYTAPNRRDIMRSRTEPTRVLGEAIARCRRPPGVWLNASTATIYKHTLGRPWDESGEIGAMAAAKDLFSVEVAQAWEKEFDQAPTPHTRKATLRTAMVLGSGRNSVFPVLRRLVKWRLGGSMGAGNSSFHGFTSAISPGRLTR
jgi:NAD dependent epimerase/dehydratase family enzyme